MIERQLIDSTKPAPIDERLCPETYIMRFLTLITMFAFLFTLAGCAHHGEHVCGPTCCAACCDSFAGNAPERDGQTAAQWAARANGADAWTRQEVIVNLAAMGPSTLCYAESWMNSKDPGTRFCGVEMVRMIGPQANSTIPHLRALTQDASSEVRTAAVRALGTMHKDDLNSAVGDLERALVLARRAVRVTSNGATLDTLGWVHLKRGATHEEAELLGSSTCSLRKLM